jgi:hypothetical protein
VFANSAAQQSSKFAQTEIRIARQLLSSLVASRFTEYGDHLFGVLGAIFSGIEAQQHPVERKHESGLFPRYAQARQLRELPHAVDFAQQIPPASACQAVGPPPARAFVFLELFDPIVLEQASQCPVQRASAEFHPAAAHPLHVLEDGVAMTRLLGEAQQDEENRFGEGRSIHMTYSDMSYYAILEEEREVVKGTWNAKLPGSIAA